jgi:hypothetical protein
MPSKLAPSKPSSLTIKQNPSSKPAIGKMPTASSSSSSSSSSAPAAPEVDPMSRPLADFLQLRETDQEPIDAQHMRSLDAMLEEWACNHLHSEVATCLCELNQPYTHALFVHDIVTQCCDKGPSFFVKCVELLETLCRRKECLNEEKFDEALRYLGSEKFEKEMRLDLPSYLDFLALIVARGSPFNCTLKSFCLAFFLIFYQARPTAGSSRLSNCKYFKKKHLKNARMLAVNDRATTFFVLRLLRLLAARVRAQKVTKRIQSRRDRGDDVTAFVQCCLCQDVAAKTCLPT